MFKIEMPVSFWTAQVDKAERFFATQVERDMQRIANEGALYARGHHDYVTRHPSDGLERNTVGTAYRQSRATFGITIEYKKEYAQYVEARGLTNSAETQRYVQAQLLEYLNKVPKMIRGSK